MQPCQKKQASSKDSTASSIKGIVEYFNTSDLSFSILMEHKTTSLLIRDFHYIAWSLFFFPRKLWLWRCFNWINLRRVGVWPDNASMMVMLLHIKTQTALFIYFSSVSFELSSFLLHLCNLYHTSKNASDLYMVTDCCIHSTTILLPKQSLWH